MFLFGLVLLAATVWLVSMLDGELRPWTPWETAAAFLVVGGCIVASLSLAFGFSTLVAGARR